MKITILLFSVFLIFTIEPARAEQHCWWTASGVQHCVQGWSLRDGRELREEQREEWWRARRHHDYEERWRREGGRW